MVFAGKGRFGSLDFGRTQQLIAICDCATTSPNVKAERSSLSLPARLDGGTGLGCPVERKDVIGRYVRPSLTYGSVERFIVDSRGERALFEGLRARDPRAYERLYD